MLKLSIFFVSISFIAFVTMEYFQFYHILEMVPIMFMEQNRQKIRHSEVILLSDAGLFVVSKRRLKDFRSRQRHSTTTTTTKASLNCILCDRVQSTILESALLLSAIEIY